MSPINYDAIQEIIDMRFTKTTFKISCFDSIEEIAYKAVSLSDTIIIVYEYRKKYYKNIDISLQDVDYVIVTRQKDEPFIYLSDVIDSLIMSEYKGLIKPNHHMYIEGIQRIKDNKSTIPVYRILWGN